jgi:hypothetical protein
VPEDTCNLPNVRPEGAEVRAALIDIDSLFDEQLRRIGRKLDRVGARLDAAAANERKLSLIEAYSEAETLNRLAQIAENQGRVVLPGLDQYDNRAPADWNRVEYQAKRFGRKYHAKRAIERATANRNTCS